MFGFISKKKLKNYMYEVQQSSTKENLNANYDTPISEKQQETNLYAQGYEDGTSNFYNALCRKFKIKRKFQYPRSETE